MADKLPAQPTRKEQSLARKLLPKMVISIALGALFAWLVSRGGVPLLPTAESLSRVQPGAVVLYILILIAMHFFRGSRWRFLIRPVKSDIPFWDGLWINWIGFFAIFAFPLRLGEMARPAVVKMRHGVSLSAGFGTVAVERVFDGFITSLCVLWALLVLPVRSSDDPLAQALPFYGYLAVTVFSAALVGLAIFLWKKDLAVRLVQLTFGLLSKRLGSVVAAKVADVAEGVRSIAHPKLATAFVAETLLYWTLNATGMWVLAIGCGLEMSYAHSFGIMGVLAIGILLPAGPGLFGNFQLAVSTALRLYFAEALVGTQGAVYIFLLYGIQAILITVAGIVPLYVMKMSLADLIKPPDMETIRPPANEDAASLS